MNGFFRLIYMERVESKDDLLNSGIAFCEKLEREVYRASERHLGALNRQIWA